MKQLLFIVITTLGCVNIQAQVSPLVQVEWGQNTPYNDKCPVIGTDHAMAGCIAVTMAQLMSVYQYPDTFPWADIITGNSPDDVSDLIYNVGRAAKTTYSLTNSTAKPTNQVKALVDSFGYDKDMIILSRSSVTDAEWENRIKAELDNGHPVMVSARDANYGGHSFIIDGYNETGYHINWGWAGKDNGYYRLDSLVTSLYDFSHDQRIFLGCTPDDGKQTIVNYLEADCQLSDTLMYLSDVENNKRLTLNIRVNNRCYRPFNGYYYIYYVSEDGTSKRASNSKNYVLSTLEPDYYYDDVIRLSPPKTPGTYRLSMQCAQLLSTQFIDMALTGDTSFTILPTPVGIENPVTDAVSTNNGTYYNVAGQQIAKPKGKRLFKRTRQGGQLVI